jgi:hypothetical protein
MIRNRFCAPLVAACLTAGTLAITTGPAGASGRHADPGCSLSAETLGGSPVIFLDAAGFQHGAWFQIDWVEPQITQVQYMWSTSTGVLQYDVMKDQGSGTYTASLWSLDKSANPVTLLATCSIAV